MIRSVTPLVAWLDRRERGSATDTRSRQPVQGRGRVRDAISDLDC